MLITTLALQNVIQKYILLHFYGFLKGSSEYFLPFFLKPVCLTMIAKKFQIHGVKFTGKYIRESKNWICLLIPSSKTLPQVFIITTPRRRKLPIPTPKKSVLKISFSPAEKGRTMELKTWSKLNLQEYWPQVLINCTICNLYILGFCFVVA